MCGVNYGIKQNFYIERVDAVKPRIINKKSKTFSFRLVIGDDEIPKI